MLNDGRKKVGPRSPECCVVWGATKSRAVWGIHMSTGRPSNPTWSWRGDAGTVLCAQTDQINVVYLTDGIINGCRLVAVSPLLILGQKPVILLMQRVRLSRAEH